VNNPFLSIIILVAIFISNVEAGVGCFLGGLVATVTELALGLHPWSLVENGVAPFNGALIGSVIPSLYPLLNLDAADPLLVIMAAVVMGAVASVFIASALNNLLGTFSLPFMTLPFNIVAICTFITLMPDQDIHIHSLPENITEPIIESNVTASISWLGVGQGILLSMGQVYAVNCLLSSCLINLAVALYSPLLFCMCTIGASIGCLLPLAFLPPGQYTQIYLGLWGYSPLLSMAAVSCVIRPMSGTSLVAGTVNTFTTVFIQKALAVKMGKASLPVFTLPFTLSSLLILLAWQQKGQTPAKQEGDPLSSAEKQDENTVITITEKHMRLRKPSKQIFSDIYQ